MELIDTHTHIYYKEKYDDLAEVISRSKQMGMTHILLPNVDIASIESLHALVDQYPGYCIPMMGMHPTSITENWISDLGKIKTLFSARQYIAVGEIGLDLYWDKALIDAQRAAFEEQLCWSIEYNLPVSIHAREAIPETIECIRNVGQNKIKGVFHSFCGNADELREILSLGDFLLGINGVVTFKNSDLPSVLKNTDLTHIVIETDAPYLAPMPYRGKRNEPAYTSFVAEKLSNIYGVSPQEVAQITSTNAKRMFNLK